ncbi:MAG TPA: TIGR01459 family HAD-type hydrolase, partial [Gammaproteobacteria bacterium]|nr:TIGR01459 family HAD-type hydrolase [Gammaproteobacteria bacterium]
DFDGVELARGMSALAPRYDGFILDQWGVLHDGTRPYDGAAECLERLHAAGKRIVVLSNSGKREAENLRVMARMGFDVSVLERCVCAGEEARAAIEARADAFHAALGRRCYAFTRGGDRAVLEGIGLEFVDRIEDADFLAVLGIDSPQRSLPDYEAELTAGARKDLPMVCANPDIARLTPNGLVDAQGVLAVRYEALGGRVAFHGKPYAAIYRSCLAALECAAERVLMVGDSVDHDVLGAQRAGIASALIPGAVHGPELGVAWGETPGAEAWRAFAARASAQPDYLLAAFNW